MKVPNLRGLGEIQPAALYPLLHAYKVRNGLLWRDVAVILGCHPSALEEWSLGRPPCAAVLLRAEVWVNEQREGR